MQVPEPVASKMDASQTTVRRSTRSSARALSEPPSGAPGDNASQDSNKRTAPDAPLAAAGHDAPPHPRNNPRHPNNPHLHNNASNAAASGSGSKKTGKKQESKKARKPPPQRRPAVPDQPRATVQASGPPAPAPPQLQAQQLAQLNAQHQARQQQYLQYQAQMLAHQAQMQAQMQAQLLAAGPPGLGSITAPGPSPAPREYTIQQTARFLSGQTGIPEAVALQALESTKQFKSQGFDLWIEEAQMFLAMQNEEEEEETVQLRQCMATSLAHAEAAKAALAAAAPSHPEELADEHSNSAILTSLSALVCINLLLGPSCIVREALIALLNWEKKCHRWYKGPGTKAYFNSLALECCACLDTRDGFPVRTTSPAHHSSAPSAALPQPASAGGAAAAAREAAAKAAAAGASSSLSLHTTTSHPLRAASTSNPTAQSVSTSTAQLIRCRPEGCQVCSSALTSLPHASLFNLSSSAPTSDTPHGLASKSLPCHPLSLVSPHPLHPGFSSPATAGTAPALTSSLAASAAAAAQTQTHRAQQVTAALSALRELCIGRAAQIQESVTKMPETANAVPKIFFWNLPAVSNADSDVVCLEATDSEVQSRNQAGTSRLTQPAPRAKSAGRMGRPEAAIELLD